MNSWKNSISIYYDRRMLAVLCLGFSSGLPLLLVFSTLSLWLKDEGISKTAIGLFSLVRTPYSFKFLWSPLIDRLPIPVLTEKLGRRRAWAFVIQIALILSIIALSYTNPSMSPEYTAIFAILVAFCSASQDIVIDAIRIEKLNQHERGAGASLITLGYRIGMLVAGAGAVYMAEYFSWQVVYQCIGLCVLIGLITTIAIKEPQHPEDEKRDKTKKIPISKQIYYAIIEPFKDFMSKKGWGLILLFIMFYKLCDAYAGVMANPFYVEMGFSKAEIASISKVFGVGATIFGTILGGVFVGRYGIMKSLLIAGILQGVSNLVFAMQAYVGHDTYMLMVTIAFENVAGGMGTAAFVAYMSSLCNVAYTATQYALLTSLMGFARDLFASTSGFLADRVDWVSFFIITSFAAIPGLILLIIMMKKFPTLSEELEEAPSVQEVQEHKRENEWNEI